MNYISVLTQLDGRLLKKISKVRHVSDKYDIIEKIGKGAYGNVLHF
jgi:hypothetical protein